MSLTPPPFAPSLPTSRSQLVEQTFSRLWWPQGADDDAASLARERLLAFTQRLNPTYRAAPHHTLIAETLEAVEAGHLDRVIFVLPPRHGKSELASVNFPPWYLGRNPDKRIIATSYAALLAYAFSRRARNQFRHPLWPFPGVRTAGDLSNVQHWAIEDHRGGYFCAGVGGGITGMGGNVLIVDDAFRGETDADSLLVRERTWDWYRSDALTRLTPDGAVILIGTRWHADDLIGRAMQQDDEHWHVVHFPAIDAGGQALWPEQWPVDKLEKRRTAIGERAWAALYQGTPIVDAGQLLPPWRWRFWHYPGQPLPPVVQKGPDGQPVACPCLPLPPFWDEQMQSWDMTFSDAATADWVCGQVWGEFRTDRYLLDQHLARLDFPASLAAVRLLASRWPYAKRTLVELSANGPAVVQTLRSELDGIVGVTPLGSKISRVNAVTPIIEAGHVHLPHPRLAPWVDGFIAECAAFPLGAHDDQVDALSQALNALAIRKGAVTTVSSYLPNGNGHHDDDEPHWEGRRRW